MTVEIRTMDWADEFQFRLLTMAWAEGEFVWVQRGFPVLRGLDGQRVLF